VSGSGGQREIGNVEFRNVSGRNGASVRQDHGDSWVCWFAVLMRNMRAQKVTSAAGISNGVGRKWWRGGS
jgi:hypothetical protein